MLMIVYLGIGISAVVASSLVPLVGLWRFLTVSLLISLAIAPYPLFLLPDGEAHFGVTFPEYVPMTYSVLLAAMTVGTLRARGVGRVLATGVPLVVYLVVLTYLSWGATSAQWAGGAHLVTAMLAVATGWAIAQAVRNDPGLGLLWTVACLGVVLVQLLACVAQLEGIGLSVYSEVNYFMAESRPIGTFNHPSVLGKVLFILVITLLPISRSGGFWTRRLAWASIFIALPLTAATQSRANTIALAGAIFLWILLNPKLGKRKRIVAFVSALVASISLAIVLVPRFLLDPEGGDRPALLATGLDLISKSPWLGIGPNSYSQVVGRYDTLAATGLPVHNALLLTVAEIGILGTILVCVPLLFQFTQALLKIRTRGLPGDAAMAVLVSTPGFLLINMTGWGFLSGGSLILWALAVGISLGFMAKLSAPLRPGQFPFSRVTTLHRGTLASNFADSSIQQEHTHTIR